MKNFYFILPAGMLLPNIVLSIFGGLQLFSLLCFGVFFIIIIRQDNLSVKARNGLLLNIGSYI